MEDEEKLRRLYFGHDGAAGAFTGQTAFEKAARQKFPTMKFAVIRRFYASLPLTQTHRIVPRAKLFREIMVSELGKNFCMDGLYLGAQFKTAGATYAYTSIDMMSRKMAIRITPALSKLPSTGLRYQWKISGGDQAVKALDEFVRELDLKPGARLWTDAGTDFRSRVFQAALQQHDFSHYFSNPSNPSKASILERQHRSIRSVAMRILRSEREQVAGGIGEHGYRRTMRQALLAAVKIHNSSYSRAIGMAPDQVTSETLPQVLAYQQRQSAKTLDNFLRKRIQQGAKMRTLSLPSEPTLAIGTRVRIRLSGNISETPTAIAFAKSFASITHSSTVYVVVGTRLTSPTVSYVVAPEGSPNAVLPFSFSRSNLLVVPD